MCCRKRSGGFPSRCSLPRATWRAASGACPEAAGRRAAGTPAMAEPAAPARQNRHRRVAPPPSSARAPQRKDAGSPVQPAAGAEVTDMQLEFDGLIAEAMLSDDEVAIELETARARAARMARHLPVFTNLDQARERLIVRARKPQRRGESGPLRRELPSRRAPGAAHRHAPHRPAARGRGSSRVFSAS